MLFNYVWYLWRMAYDHMPCACSLQSCFQLPTNAKAVIWRECFFAVHPVPHDTACIPADANTEMSAQTSHKSKLCTQEQVVHTMMHDPTSTLAGCQPLASYYSLHHTSMSSSKLYIHPDVACLYDDSATAAALHLAQPDHPPCKLCLDHQKTMQGNTSKCSWNRGKAAGGVQSQAMLQ